jgi:hypothetical protein
LTSFKPKIRVEIYIPIRHHPAYKATLSWVIEEFTQLRGGCTVNENVAGFYLAKSNQVIHDSVSIVYCDFPMNWQQKAERTDVLEYCTSLQRFLLQSLWEEEILIGAYPVSHLRQ